MQRKITFLLLVSASLAMAAAPENDRSAILAMAGNFKVIFDFRETAMIAKDYPTVSKPYHEEALEVVCVAEDSPERITLQHILVVGSADKPKIIKHWAQVWTWEDTRVLDYAGSDGSDVWQRHTITSAQASGHWSQLVTSVDDTPRYEGIGRWTHEHGESSWTSEPTRRPLPRREYEARDDYDYLIVINRHTLTPSGWIHSQDNRKVVDRDGKKQIIAHEVGLNRYNRTDDVLATQADRWWMENQKVWNPIREFWVKAGEDAGDTFSYQTTHGGVGLSKKFNELEKAKPTPEAIVVALTPYLTVSR